MTYIGKEKKLEKLHGVKLKSDTFEWSNLN